MSLTALYLYYFRSEMFLNASNAKRKTSFDTQATISLKNRRFDEKSATKLTSAGIHAEAHACCVVVL